MDKWLVGSRVQVFHCVHKKQEQRCEKSDASLTVIFAFPFKVLTFAILATLLAVLWFAAGLRLPAIMHSSLYLRIHRDTTRPF